MSVGKVLTLVLLLAAASYAARSKIKLDFDWRFHLGDVQHAQDPNFDDRSWRELDVPHDFVVEGKFTQSADMSHGYLPYGIGWYRKTFSSPVPIEGKSAWFTFDGMQTSSQVWLNGNQIANHPTGYTTFRASAAGLSSSGQHVLAARVDSNRPDSWWYDGGGIYRHVWLEVAEKLHIAPWGVWAQSQVTGAIEHVGQASFAAAAVTPTTTVANENSQSMRFRIKSDVLDASGAVVATATTDWKTIAAGDKGTPYKQQMNLARASLWSVETPYLYTLKTTILTDAGEIDEVTTTFGVRKTEYNAQHGFRLNDKVVKVKGMCNHQDFAGVGVAVPDTMQDWRVKKMKEMGANAWRTAHNPPNPELLDACDREGMLVWDENHRNVATAQGIEDLNSMLYRDRNHPSIIYWSICNEALCNNFDASAAKQLVKIVHDVDPTRPTTAAMNGGWGGAFSDAIDVVGFNYNINQYDGYHRNHPNQPLTGSETSSALTDRGIYVTSKERSYVCAYDINKPGWGNTAEEAWEPIDQREWMEGAFIWTGFDYKGEPTPYQWPNINSHFGVIDIAGFPKDAFYLYQSMWKDGEHILHLLPHWNGNLVNDEAANESSNEQIDVWAYTNAAKVELFVNGASQGSKAVKRDGHASWKVNYAAGKISAKGYDASGKQVSETEVQTTGAAHSIVLEAELFGRKSIAADGQDVALIKASIVDSQGRVVPTANNFITFTVSGVGSVVGVGNGDPSCHEPDRASTRSAWNGLARAIVGASKKAGTLELTATAPGLQSGSLSISVVA